MRYLLSTLRPLAVFVITAAAFGQTPSAPQQSAEPTPQQRLAQAQAALAKAEQAAPVKRLKELSAKQDQLSDSISDKQAALNQEAEKLWGSPEVVAYYNAQRDVEDARRDIEDKAHAEISERAQKLYSQRHQELRSLAAPQTPEARKLGMDVLSYPRIDGSTSMQPLALIAACRILGSPYAWIYDRSHGRMLPREPADFYLSNIPRFTPGRFYRDPHDDDFTLASTYPQAISSAEAKEGDERRLPAIINSLLVRNTGTHEAYVNLIGGKSDLALLARKPSQEEQTEAAAKGVQLQLTPIGWDALVFIVNERNPISQLSQDQIRDIYAGKLTSWKGLGGRDEKIIPFRREKNSGSQELYEELLLAGRPMTPVDKDAPGAPRAPRASRTSAAKDVPRSERLIVNGMGGPFNRLFQEQNGIAFSVFAYEHFMAGSPYTRTIAVDGALPSLQTIASGRYPLRFPVYAVTRQGEPANSPAMRLLTWLGSPEGQQVIRESGLVARLPQ